MQLSGYRFREWRKEEDRTQPYRVSVLILSKREEHKTQPFADGVVFSRMNNWKVVLKRAQVK
jgi:hypothetical protein